MSNKGREVSMIVDLLSDCSSVDAGLGISRLAKGDASKLCSFSQTTVVELANYPSTS